MRENGPVIYQKIDTPKGRIVKILLNRPDHGNRIDGEMWHDFMEAVDMASADRDARVVIFGGGTGNPFFSTDTASALRAAEINAEIVFKATMVDGVYDKDPKKYADAKKYDTLTFSRVLADQLAVMDSTAATMCRDNSLPILVFDILHPENIAKAVAGEPIGTLVVEQ